MHVLRSGAIGFFRLCLGPVSLPRWKRDSPRAHSAGVGGGRARCSPNGCGPLQSPEFSSLKPIDVKDREGAPAAQEPFATEA